MKKGDIVQLKPGNFIWAAESAHRLSSKRGNLPFYTLKSDSKYESAGCGGEIELMVRFDEMPGYVFEASYFELALPSGEPDVKELMKQVEAVEVFA